MTRGAFLVIATIITATISQGCTMTTPRTNPSHPVDEQEAKASSLAVVADIQQAWTGLVSSWSSPDTLAYLDAGACLIVTSATASGAGASDSSGIERLRPAFDAVLARHGYSGGTVDILNGSPVLRAERGDGRVVEFRGRSGDLDVLVPAHSSQCTSAPRRI